MSEQQKAEALARMDTMGDAIDSRTAPTVAPDSPVDISASVGVCARCAADPHPASFGSPRRCAFRADGRFTPDNWNCATVNALLDLAEPDYTEVFGDDESMHVVPTLLDGECCERHEDSDNLDTRGWFVFTRYKRRGCTSSAVHVGDFWPPARVTLAKVLESLSRYEARVPCGGRP